MNEPLRSGRFLAACRRQPVDRTPIWLMRQAGRYLPEYRALRAQHSMLDMIRTPELAVEITLQPLRRFELDAAIIFADILPLLMGAGIDLEYAAGEGPVIHNPVRSPGDVEALRTPPPEESLPGTLEAVRLVRGELDGKTPLIGFSGAPFTLAAYAVEGGGSQDYRHTKALMYGEPAVWHALMDKLARLAGEYLAAQVRAGAQAVQLFDSWAGALAPSDYRAFVLPYTRQAIEIAGATGAPVILFSTGTAGMLETLREAGAGLVNRPESKTTEDGPQTALEATEGTEDTGEGPKTGFVDAPQTGSRRWPRTDGPGISGGRYGGLVIGVDWRVDLDAAWERIGYDVAIQGNLDPQTLLAPPDLLRERAGEILQRAGGRPGHVFNLGHGVLPGTPVENVQALVDFVHGWSG